MLELSLEYESHIINDSEIIREGTSYTYDTVKSIKDTHRNSVLYLIIGFDNLHLFHKWYRYKKILEECNIIVMKRNQNESSLCIDGSLSEYITADRSIFSDVSYGKIFIENTFEIDISSSEIRRKLKNKETVEGLVHPELLKWLSSNYIY
tara:strand:+ start:369 stop:818 length:450 start_codon:yes stop_codon:yes gene_type:complete